MWHWYYLWSPQAPGTQNITHLMEWPHTLFAHPLFHCPDWSIPCHNKRQKVGGIQEGKGRGRWEKQEVQRAEVFASFPEVAQAPRTVPEETWRNERLQGIKCCPGQEVAGEIIIQQSKPSLGSSCFTLAFLYSHCPFCHKCLSLFSQMDLNLLVFSDPAQTYYHSKKPSLLYP